MKERKSPLQMVGSNMPWIIMGVMLLASLLVSSRYAQ